MIIAVGSRNRTKLEAVRLAFSELWPDIACRVVGCSVDSDVRSQPMSDLEAYRGARARAGGISRDIEADFRVGLEGGLQNFEGRWFNSTWVVVIDRTGAEGVGTGIRMEVLPSVVRLILEGKELADACNEVFHIDNTKNGVGYFGLMTSNVMSRTTAFRDAVVAALAPFLHPELMG
jgi:inosine/xanthosine triphosphatase